jgi:cytochrome b
MRNAEPGMLPIWDPLVRIGHWVLLIACIVAYVTEGEPIRVHVWAGYTVSGYILLRVVWGFVGPRRARFAELVYRPGTVLAYLRDLVRFRAPRHLGHSPAGGAMVVALLLSLTATVTTGLLAYGDDKHAGPLAFLFAPAAPQVQLAPEPLFPTLDQPAAAGGGPGRREESELIELHETFVNVTLLLVIVHVGGVILASAAHRENLVLAMFTGRKRAE